MEATAITSPAVNRIYDEARRAEAELEMAEKLILGFDQQVYRLIENPDDGDDHRRLEHVKTPELLEIIQRLQMRLRLAPM